MKKKGLLVLTILLMVFAMTLPMETQAAAKAKWVLQNETYYAYKGSKLVRNKWVGDYYAGSDGSMVTDAWVKGKYFVGVDGKWIENFKGGWYKIGKNYYFYTKKGVKKEGWYTRKNKVYYLIPEKKGARARGWKKIEGKKYYFLKKTGTNYLITGMRKIGTKYYYLDPENAGAAQKGWVIYNNRKYYFSPTYQRVSGWQTIDGKKYMFNSNGVMQTGWYKKSAKKTYYLDPETGAAMVGLVSIDRNTYYFSKSGIMQKSKAVTVNGTVYNIDANGVCTATIMNPTVTVSDKMLFFTAYESGTEAYAQVGGDSGNACGKYQFDYRYSLLPFVKYCYSKDKVFFAEFKTYALLTDSQKGKLQSNTKFYDAWRTIYKRSPKGFAAYQDAFAKQEYYDVTANYLLTSFKSSGYSLNLTNRNDVIKGAVFSFSIQHGQWTAAGAVKAAGIKNSTTDKDFITKLYNYRIKKWPAYKSRYTSEMQLALSLL